MMLKLKQPNAQFPAGGFGFTDPRTKRVWNGYEGTPQMTAVSIVQHRQANPTLYPPSETQWFDVLMVIQEIYAYKFQTMPELFVGYGGPPITIAAVTSPAAQPPSGLVCSCGSTSFSPVYCATCGGQKIKSWKCNSCGKGTA